VRIVLGTTRELRSNAATKEIKKTIITKLLLYINFGHLYSNELHSNPFAFQIPLPFYLLFPGMKIQSLREMVDS